MTVFFFFWFLKTGWLWSLVYEPHLVLLNLVILRITNTHMYMCMISFFFFILLLSLSPCEQFIRRTWVSTIIVASLYYACQTNRNYRPTHNLKKKSDSAIVLRHQGRHPCSLNYMPFFFFLRKGEGLYGCGSLLSAMCEFSSLIRLLERCAFFFFASFMLIWH